MSPECEPSLISDAISGDRLALEKLLQVHAGSLSNHIAGRLPARLAGVVGVEDILQQTLLQAFLDINKVRNTTPRGFLAWLKSVAEMRLLDALKSQQRQKRGGQFRRISRGSYSLSGSLVDLLDNLPGESPTASHAMATTEALLAMQVSMVTLPTDQREAIRLHVLEERSLADTAAAMKRTPGAVRALVHRGKRNLAEAMGRASAWLSTRD